MLKLIAAAVQQQLAIFLERLGSQALEPILQLLLRLGEHSELHLGHLTNFRRLGRLLNRSPFRVRQTGLPMLTQLTNLAGCLTPTPGLREMVSGKADRCQQTDQK